MTVTKTTSRTYEIKFFPDAWKTTQEEFLKLREKKGMSTRQFKNCFVCGCMLPLDKVPTFIQVQGVGNRFACEQCTEQEAAQ